MNSTARQSELPPEFDARALAAPDIDGFCSSSLWVLPARTAFHPTHEILHWTDGEGHVALAAGESEIAGRYLMPIEAVWGLASPVIHRSSRAGAQCLSDALRSTGAWRVALLTGLGVDSALFHAVVRQLSGQYKLRGTQRANRHVASLEGGLDGFLSRRRRKFRASLRRMQRSTESMGVQVERHQLNSADDVMDVWNRILAIERQSWKSLSGNGVASGPMAIFTPAVLRRCAEKASALVLFATHEGRDIGYLHGGLVDGHFRGLQMSFVDDWRPHGIGNLMQFSAITWLCALEARTYDLGSELPYKRRWAETEFETTGVVVTR